MSESVRDISFDLAIAPAAAQPTRALSAKIMNGRTALLIREMLFRLASVSALGYFAVGAAAAYVADPWRISLLAMVFSESLMLVLLMFSAMPKYRDWHPVSVITAWGVCLYPFLVNVEPGLSLAPWQITTTLSLLGCGLNVWAKLNLGGSFSILPGVRAIVASGPYRFIRHPIYAGFMINSVGFLLHDYSTHNFVVLSTVFACEFYRVGREEAALSRDPEYRAYGETVRYRFIPGVF